MSSMSISGAGGPTSSALSSALSAVTGAGHGRHRGVGPLEDAATALGMSAQDVLSALEDGRSLDDLAADQGMSHDDLVSTMKASMTADLRGSDRADAILERITTTKGVDALRPPQGARGPGGAGGPGGPGGPPPTGPPPDDEGTGVFGSSGLTGSQQETLTSLASLLGTDSASLLDSLQSGTSLSDLVKDAGVESGSLASVLQTGLLYDRRL